MGIFRNVSSSFGRVCRIVVSFVGLYSLTACISQYAFEMSKNYTPTYNPGGGLFDEDEEFARSYEVYKKRREDLVGNNIEDPKGKKSAKNGIGAATRRKMMEKLRSYGVISRDEVDGDMVNSEGIDLSRIRGARFIDPDLNQGRGGEIRKPGKGASKFPDTRAFGVETQGDDKGEGSKSDYDLKKESVGVIEEDDVGALVVGLQGREDDDTDWDEEEDDSLSKEEIDFLREDEEDQVVESQDEEGDGSDWDDAADDVTKEENGDVLQEDDEEDQLALSNEDDEDFVEEADDSSMEEGVVFPEDVSGKVGKSSGEDLDDDYDQYTDEGRTFGEERGTDFLAGDEVDSRVVEPRDTEEYADWDKEVGDSAEREGIDFLKEDTEELRVEGPNAEGIYDDYDLYADAGRTFGGALGKEEAEAFLDDEVQSRVVEPQDGEEEEYSEEEGISDDVLGKEESLDVVEEESRGADPQMYGGYDLYGDLESTIDSASKKGDGDVLAEEEGNAQESNKGQDPYDDYDLYRDYGLYGDVGGTFGSSLEKEESDNSEDEEGSASDDVAEEEDFLTNDEIASHVVRPQSKEGGLYGDYDLYSDSDLDDGDVDSTLRDISEGGEGVDTPEEDEVASILEGLKGVDSYDDYGLYGDDGSYDSAERGSDDASAKESETVSHGKEEVKNRREQLSQEEDLYSDSDLSRDYNLYSDSDFYGEGALGSYDGLREREAANLAKGRRRKLKVRKGYEEWNKEIDEILKREAAKLTSESKKKNHEGKSSQSVKANTRSLPSDVSEKMVGKGEAVTGQVRSQSKEADLYSDYDLDRDYGLYSDSDFYGDGAENVPGDASRREVSDLPKKRRNRKKPQIRRSYSEWNEKKADGILQEEVPVLLEDNKKRDSGIGSRSAEADVDDIGVFPHLPEKVRASEGMATPQSNEEADLYSDYDLKRDYNLYSDSDLYGEGAEDVSGSSFAGENPDFLKGKRSQKKAKVKNSDFYGEKVEGMSASSFTGENSDLLKDNRSQKKTKVKNSDFYGEKVEDMSASSFTGENSDLLKDNRSQKKAKVKNSHKERHKETEAPLRKEAPRRPMKDSKKKDSRVESRREEATMDNGDISSHLPEKVEKSREQKTGRRNAQSKGLKDYSGLQHGDSGSRPGSNLEKKGADPLKENKDVVDLGVGFQSLEEGDWYRDYDLYLDEEEFPGFKRRVFGGE